MRNPTVDVMKGIGIILVALYHAIGINTDAIASLNNGLFDMIACFFMQLFMVVSGYLIYNKVGDLAWVKRSSRRFIIPIVVFLFVYWCWRRLMPGLININDLPLAQYLVYELYSGFTGLVIWYVWCLLICYWLAYIVKKFRHRTIAAVIIVVVVNLIPVSQFGMLYVKWYSLFLFAGYLLHHYQDSKMVDIGKKAVYASLVLFPLGGYLTRWMTDYQNIDYGYIGTGAIFPGVTSGHATLVLVMLMMAFLGVGFIYSISSLLSKWRISRKALAYIGGMTLGIFYLHPMFVGICSNYWVSALLSLGISIGLYELYTRIVIRLLRRSLFEATQS